METVSKYIINRLDLTDWVTTKDIIRDINDTFGYDITAREWRRWVYEYNKNFVENGGRRWFIASSNKGYCRTKRKSLIRNTVNRRRNRLYHEWQKTNTLLKALGEDNNERLDL